MAENNDNKYKKEDKLEPFSEKPVPYKSNGGWLTTRKEAAYSVIVNNFSFNTDLLLFRRKKCSVADLELSPPVSPTKVNCMQEGPKRLRYNIMIINV